jgi:hypothetical protein
MALLRHAECPSRCPFPDEDRKSSADVQIVANPKRTFAPMPISSSRPGAAIWTAQRIRFDLGSLISLTIKTKSSSEIVSEQSSDASASATDLARNPRTVQRHG